MDYRLDPEDARNVAHLVTRKACETLGAEELLDWHSSALARCYLSPTSHFELVVNFSRGFDTNMRFSVDSHAEESVDRLTDRTIDVVKQATKAYVNDRVDGHHLEDTEYIRRLRIARFNGDGDDAGGFDHQYTVEFETETIDSLVVTDQTMSGNPHLAGRRLMISDIWHRHVLRDIAVDDIPAEFDNVLTADEAAAAIEYARENDDFKTADALQDEQEETEFVRFEERLDEE